MEIIRPGGRDLKDMSHGTAKGRTLSSLRSKVARRRRAAKNCGFGSKSTSSFGKVADHPPGRMPIMPEYFFEVAQALSAFPSVKWPISAGMSR